MLLKIVSFLVDAVHVGLMNLTSTPVTTQQQAILIGTKVAHTIYSDIVDFNQLSVTKVEDVGDERLVWFTEPSSLPTINEDGFIKCTARLGGGPEIRINKSTGRIDWCLTK